MIIYWVIPKHGHKITLTWTREKVFLYLYSFLRSLADRYVNCIQLPIASNAHLQVLPVRVFACAFLGFQYQNYCTSCPRMESLYMSIPKKSSFFVLEHYQIMDCEVWGKSTGKLQVLFARNMGLVSWKIVPSSNCGNQEPRGLLWRRRINHCRLPPFLGINFPSKTTVSSYIYIYNTYIYIYTLICIFK